MDNPSYVAILMNKNPALAKLCIAKKNGQIRAAAKRNAHTEAASITTPFRNLSVSKPGGALLASNSSDLSGLGNVYANNLDNGVQALDMVYGGNHTSNSPTKQVHGFTGKLDIVIVDLEKGNKYSVSANFTGHNPKEGGVVARSTIIGIDISASAKFEDQNTMRKIIAEPKFANPNRVYFKYKLYNNGIKEDRWGSFPKPMNNWVFHNDGIFFDDVPPIEP